MGHFLLVRGMHKLFAASCCDSGGQTRDGRGWNGTRETEGGEESEEEWTLQSDLKFVFNQASRSQTTMLHGAKRHNFIGNGAGVAGKDGVSGTNNLTVTPQRVTSHGFNLVLLSSSTPLQLLYAGRNNGFSYAALVYVWITTSQKKNPNTRKNGHKNTFYWSTRNLSLMFDLLSPWSMCRVNKPPEESQLTRTPPPPHTHTVVCTGWGVSAHRCECHHLFLPLTLTGSVSFLCYIWCR